MSANGKNHKAIKTAVVGYGLAGRVFHCPFVSAVPGLELAAIVQRRGDEAAEAYPGAHIARDIEEVLQDASIELVVVGTPNSTHFELAQRVLQAGKHCVVDKPFTETSSEARELLALAQKSNTLLFPFHNRRYDGDYLTLKKLIADATLGRIVEISSRFDRFRPGLRENSWKETGFANGILFDLGPHLVDQALSLFGVPDFVDARIYRDRAGTAVDDGFDVTLEYRSVGMRYKCGATLLSADVSPRYRVHGTGGSYVKFGVDQQEPAIVAGARPPAVGSETSWLADPESMWGTLTQIKDEKAPKDLAKSAYPTLPGDYRKFYENVRDAVRGVAEPAIRPEDGYRCIQLLELAIQSDREQRSVPVKLSA